MAGIREVVIWGTGAPRREFLHVDDLADACVLLMESYEGEGHVNVGTGEDLQHPRAGRDAARRSSIRRRCSVGRREARRHAAQAARRLAPAPPRLAPPHRPARRRSRRPTVVRARTRPAAAVYELPAVPSYADFKPDSDVPASAAKQATAARPSSAVLRALRTQKKAGLLSGPGPPSPPERTRLPVHANAEPDDARGHDRLDLVGVGRVLAAADRLDRCSSWPR